MSVPPICNYKAVFDIKFKASQELVKVVDLLTITDKESFIGVLGLWYEKSKAIAET